jgi:hypothetical protein
MIANPIFDLPAVIVGSVVCVGRKELVKQVTVRSVNFNSIEANFNRALCRGTIRRNHFLHPVAGNLTWHLEFANATIPGDLFSERLYH